MKIITVVGARPQFIKAAPVSRALASVGIDECIVHTGQHYDENMSDVFFREMAIPAPTYQLNVGSSNHGRQTGRMMELIEEVVEKELPDVLLVYGDTNSTLAGALVAAKLHIPVAHVEAGLRSFKRSMPEEVNRVLADHISHWLFCPTTTAIDNLANEGITERVHHVGDVMYDAALYMAAILGDRPVVGSDSQPLEANSFILATVHRAENTDQPDRLRGILSALKQLSGDRRVLLPLHPRTRGSVEKHGLVGLLEGLDIVEPLGFLDMVNAERAAQLIVTDSGGVQKEAYFHGVPCVTMRDETEWTETVDAGWNRLAGADCARILEAASNAGPGSAIDQYGTGEAAIAIAKVIADWAAARSVPQSE